MIDPINEAQKNIVIDKTEYFLHQACEIYQRNFKPIIVDFDLKGRVAGMYRRKQNQRVIRYNPYIFAKYFEDSLETTIPHEVAHYVTDMIFTGGRYQPRPHGKEWQEVMQAFGADASRTCDYDLEGIQVRISKRHDYHCQCMTHELSSLRHNRIQKRTARYFCKKCNEELMLKVVNGQFSASTEHPVEYALDIRRS